MPDKEQKFLDDLDNVLMTLRPIGDRSSKEFMETFYERWLSAPGGTDPKQALHQTRLYFINHPEKSKYRKPVNWSPYVIVGQ